jgi:hypothetical protein
MYCNIFNSDTASSYATRLSWKVSACDPPFQFFKRVASLDNVDCIDPVILDPCQKSDNVLYYFFNSSNSDTASPYATRLSWNVSAYYPSLQFFKGVVSPDNVDCIFPVIVDPCQQPDNALQYLFILSNTDTASPYVTRLSWMYQHMIPHYNSLKGCKA